jgi:hypothetical protein
MLPSLWTLTINTVDPGNAIYPDSAEETTSSAFRIDTVGCEAAQTR